MGWRGALRSYNAAVRQIERESNRQYRQNQKLRAQYEKLAQLERARLEVAEHEDFLSRMVTIHHDKTNTINWDKISRAEEPQKPVDRKEKWLEASENLSSFKPNFFVRLLKLDKWLRSRLEAKIPIATRIDEEAYAAQLKSFEEHHAEWSEDKNFATKILAGDKDAYFEALREAAPFKGVAELGKRFEFEFISSKTAGVDARVHGLDMFPQISKTLLKSGKVSEKSMPATKYNELYLDHVCSVALRISADMFAVLPVEKVIVTTFDTRLDPATGNLTEQVLLCVVIPRSTLATLKLENVDPSSALRNFVHKVSFSAKEGMSGISGFSKAEIAKVA